MAYEARRSDDSLDEKLQEQRNTANNANNVRNASSVAMASGVPHAMAVGAAVKAADKVTGGKSSEVIGKTVSQANKMTPLGNKTQNLSNRLNESGVSDTVGKVADMKNKNASAAKPASPPSSGSEIVSKMPDANTNNIAMINANNGQIEGGETKSLPSSSVKIETPPPPPDNNKNDSSETGDEKGRGKGLGSFLASRAAVTITLIAAPLIILILIMITILSSVSGLFSEYEDAFGMSNVMGEDTGGLTVEEASEDQQKFYERVNEVRLAYQEQGKNLDALKIVAIFHVLKSEGADFDYKDISKSIIEKWADSMFDDNMYSESLFKQNLIKTIIPKYLPEKTEKQKEELADEVLDYIDRYYNLIGKESNYSSCASIGNCTYDIKGFAIPGRGNIVKSVQINDLKVRLMECGSPYGNGNYNTPIDQDLVNFEDYVAGVAYAEVGPNASEEVLKTQMVAARSFALARAAAMNNKAGKKLEQENGQWILQISSCVADQVFCNIDEGCSYMGGGDGQGGICRSGKVPGAVKTMEALPSDHPLRKAAAATQGEVLVNAQGYIIQTSYKSTDQNNWANLAQSGLNYKQILLQTYNQSSSNYGASDIEKMSCSTEDKSNCISTGEFSKWKQTDPEWSSTPMGDSGRNLGQIGCLVTSVSMLIAKSGVDVDPSIRPFNPGTFVQFLNKNGGFAAGGNFVWAGATKAAPAFKYRGQISLSGMDRATKLRKIQEIVSQKGVYAVAEVKGNTGQHWVAIDSVSGATINMMDPSTDSTDMWTQYNWANTSTLAYFQVG